MKYNHETKTTRGINHVIKQLNKKYYWPNLSNDVKRYVSVSQTCQTAKFHRHPQNKKLQLTPTPSKPLEHIHIDLFFIEREIYMTILDPFSKIGQAYKVENKNAIEITNTLLNFITHYGIPQQITADSGNEFNHLILNEFCKLHPITHNND